MPPRPLALSSLPAQDAADSPTTWILRGWLLWSLFIVYGSLVPLEFRAVPLATAWQRLAEAPLLQVGLQGRADWIANGVLYFPFGVLACLALRGRQDAAPRRLWARLAAVLAAVLVAVLPAVLMGLVLACAVEFVQAYFPPRTVSRNDLIAEALGTVAGALAGLAAARPLRSLLAGLASGGGAWRSQWGPWYALAFVGLALFPYDLLLNADEWMQKLRGANVAWLFARGDPPAGMALVIAKLLAEAMTALPLGAWWAASQVGQRPQAARSLPWGAALLRGALLGLAVELAQLAIGSGVSQGLSVLTRAAGFTAGLLAWQTLGSLQVETLRALMRRGTAPALLLYLTMLTLLHGWWAGPWMDPEAAWQRLATEVHFVPFYYHYFTTEMRAVVSLAAAVASYAPVGLLAWAWHVGARTSGAMAMMLALVVEMGRLMQPNTKPDPTNLLIAAVSAWLAHRVLSAWVSGPRIEAVPPLRNARGAPHRTVVAGHDDARPAEPPSPARLAVQASPAHLAVQASPARLAVQASPARLAVPAGALAAAAAWLAGFPVAQLPLALGLIAAAALVAWRPVWLLTLAAAAMPVLDLAPWSGRWLLDEFDVLLLLGCSVAWARLPGRRGARVADPAGPALAFAMVLLALAMATARGLWGLPAWDANAWANPMSPLNALRIAKGAVWAGVLWWLARRMVAAGLDATGAFGRGMVLGLAGTVAAVLVERLAFSYLLDFASDYRIAGPISAMSLGGAYIECFIAAATPFLLVRLLPPAPLGQMAGGAVLLAGASYALMVTFSRGGYAAMALGVVVVLVATLASPTRRWRRVIAASAMAALAAAVAWPILTGTFAQKRLETVSADIGIRERHWAQGLRVMDPDLVATLFGMGLGKVPDLFFWRGTEGERAGGHRLVTDAEGRTQLQLGTGYAYFIDQIVPVQPGANLRLSYHVRFSDRVSNPAFRVQLCQKWIITSFDCSQAKDTKQVVDAGGWVHVTQQHTAPAAGPGRLPRPVRLTMVNDGTVPVSVAQLSLTDEHGRDLLRNGDFREGMDHWTWTSDHHLAWHTKSLPLGLYVEQGLLGLGAMATLLLLGALTAARAARQGRTEAAAMLAALCAFTVVGLIDTLLDVPRFLMLWLLLCLLPGLAGARPGGAAPSAAARATAP